MIPFVSKGGHGLCQEKTLYVWSGPNTFIYESETTVSGFSLTDGMLIRVRAIFEENKSAVHYRISASATFETDAAVNNMLRAPALANLKYHLNNLYDLIKKLEKNKKRRRGNKKALEDDCDGHL